MCIIAYIPKGKKIDDTVIENCFSNNSDGSGVMWYENGKVHYIKGIFSSDKLIKVFNSISPKVDRAIHCRIATSGKIGGACCHPFALTQNIDKMKKLEGVADCVIMHNGIVSFCTPAKALQSDISDTMLFIKKYLYPNRDNLYNGSLQDLIYNATNSRFLIFNKKGVIKIGDWVEDKGVFFSNSTYKKSSYKVYNWDTCYELMSDYPHELQFIIKAKNEAEGLKKADEVFAFLERAGYVPDIYSLQDTFIYYKGQAEFSIYTIKAPKSDTIKGYPYVLV